MICDQLRGFDTRAALTGRGVIIQKLRFLRQCIINQKISRAPK